MVDFLINKIADGVAAKVVDGKQMAPERPAVYELTLLQDAINEDGEAVKVRGQKLSISEPSVDQRIVQLEGELSRWKSIKARLGV